MMIKPNSVLIHPPLPDHVLVDYADELVHRDAREATFVEELLLETPEEAIRGHVAIAEHLFPPSELQVCGKHHTPLLVGIRDD